MKAKRYLRKCILPCAALMVALPVQALAGEAAAPGLGGEITTKFSFFDYTGGLGGDRAHYLERYDYQKGWGGDNRSGAYLDLDLDLTYFDGEKEVFTLERRGDGSYSHDGKARFKADKLDFSAYYSHYRSATNGIEYLFSPNQVPGGTDPSYTGNTYVRQFNNDSPNQVRYEIDRTTYGAEVDLKESLLGAGRSAALGYDGYTRDGNKLSTYILGGSDARNAANTANATMERWRGFDQPVDEDMNRGTISFTASPGGLFLFSYDGSLEKFENQAKAFKHSDIVFPATAQYNPANDATRPLGFVPDSSLLTNAIRLSKSYVNTAWSAGYAHSTLEQDSFTDPQVRLGYNTGKISNDNGYFTVNHQVMPQLGLEGHVKYQKRDNDSTYPVANLISGLVGAGETLGVRINQIETWQYGLAASYRPVGMKTSFTPGWQHVDADRDLSFHATALIDTVSLYNEDTKSDEIYLKMVTRPMQGLTLRLTPSYTWANKTGLVTEPEDSLKVKGQGSYAAANGMLLNGYYNFENRENNNNTLTDKAAPFATYSQDTDNTMQSAGLSLHVVPAKQVTTFVSLDWTQNAFESVYFSSDRRRFEATPVFAIRDRSEYDVDTYSLSLGGDLQASDLLKLNAGYTYTKSKGDVASGLIATELNSTIDGTIDNSLHSFLLGADYVLGKGLDFQAGYVYDYYSDDVYRNLAGDTLSGGVHTVMVGLVFKL